MPAGTGYGRGKKGRSSAANVSRRKMADQGEASARSLRRHADARADGPMAPLVRMLRGREKQGQLYRRAREAESDSHYSRMRERSRSPTRGRGGSTTFLPHTQTNTTRPKARPRSR